MKTTKYYGIVFLASLLIGVSCIKDDAPSIGDRGTVRIKLMEAPVNNLYFTPFTNIDTFSLFSLRRDEVSIAGTNTALSVTVMNDTAAITAYNTENESDYQPLPDSLYTLVGSSITKNGFNYTMTIQPGTTGTDFVIAMDGSKWDVSNKYAMSFMIIDSAGKRIKTGQDMVLVTVEAKNRYDGLYSLRIKTVGWSAYGIADGVTGDFPETMALLTAGPNTSDLYNTGFGSYLQPAFTTALAATQFGAATPRFVFDTESDAIVDVVNTTPDDGRGRAFMLNPDVTDSRYDPTTKTIYAAYIMKQNGRPNQEIYDTLVYKGPR